MAWSTADLPDQSGRTALVTGASGALGREIARVLAERGARVVLACRDTRRGEEVAARIGAGAEVLELDLASLDSVREAAAAFRRRHDRLDLLVNNAGVMFPSQPRTRDGFEAHFGVNHLGHFALTGLLLDLVEDVPGARVVTVASLAHRVAPRRVGPGRPGRLSAYGASKLAGLLFTRELQRRFTDAGSEAVAVAAHPGVSATGLWDEVPPLLRPVSTALLRGMSHPPRRAALPVLRAATDRLVAGGSYLGPGGFMECTGAPAPARSSRTSRDLAAQQRLWELSEEATGVSYPHGGWRGTGPAARMSEAEAFRVYAAHGPW